MAELDSLSIKIEASSKDAASAIDSLIENLKNLNEQLGVVKGNSFSKSMESVVSSANKMQESLKKVENVSYDKAISSMNTLAKSVENSTSSMSKNIEDAISNAKEFGSVIRGMEAGKLEFNEEEYKEAIQGYSEAKDAIDKFKSTLLTVGDIENPIDEVGESAEELPKATSELEKYLSKIREYKDVIRGMESGKVEFNEDIYTEAIRGYDEASSALKELKQSLLDVGDASSKAGVSLKSAFPEASSDIENMLGKLREYKAVVKDMEGGKVAFDKAQYDEAVAGVKTLTQSIKDYKNSLSGSNEGAEGVKNVGAAAEDAAIKVEQLGDALKGLGNIKQVIEGGEIKEFGFSSDVVGNFEKMLPAISDFGKQLPTIIEASKQLPMIVDSTAEVIPTRAMSDIEKMISKLREYKTVLREMESGKVAFDVEQYDEAVSGIDRLTSAIKEYKNNLVDAGKVTESLPKGLEEASEKNEKALSGESGTKFVFNLQSISSELDNVSREFDKFGNAGVKAFKFLISPFTATVNIFKGKLKDMANRMTDFRKNIDNNLKKMSQFWNRVMKTFTFMLVRKAIDAVIKSTSDAIQSMAKFSNTMGTQFNKSISLLVADFQYLGRSIVSVFAPLINAVVPIIDAIVDRIATLLSYVGMLMAALTGATSFTKAKKKVDNYAASLDKASKSAKNLTMGIDELNILSESGGGAGGGAGDWADAWEEVEIPDWAKELADKIKLTAKDIFDPLKKAWDKVKDYILSGWKYMVDQMKKLLGDVWRDFMRVWKTPETSRIFENLLNIVGDIERVIGNLAQKFREAWNYNQTGYKILRNIRDIMATLVDHARNVSYYMIGWSKNIDFKPLLTSFEQLTLVAVRVADFIGGVFEDVMILGVLKFIKFIIEEELPLLNTELKSIVDEFNFNSLRESLKPVWSAIEEMLENITVGITKAIGNLGRSLARFTHTSEFREFLNNLVKMTKMITAERVEKVLTGLGEAILAIGKALIKFVNSRAFQGFLEAIAKWIDTHSTKDIANVFLGLAKAILAFKFTAFTASKLSGFFKFITIISALKNLSAIAKGFNDVASATEAVGESASLVKGTTEAVSGFGTIVNLVKDKAIGFKDVLLGLRNVDLKGAFSGAKEGVNAFSASLSPAVVAIGSLATGFLEFKTVSSTIEKSRLGIDSLTETIIKLTAEVGLASAAFTALLGFPAGIIAGGAVAAVGAIKGIVDATNQVNLDGIYSSITTQGETTLGEVKKWYDEASKTVDDNITKWKDSERRLTQDRSDLQEYGKDIEGLVSAINNTGEATSGMADKLLGKYEELEKGINSYIDSSTDSIVANILAQKEYLTAQGYNVDEMIVNIYKTADEEKKAVGEAIKGVKEAVQKLKGLTKGTKEYNDQMKKVSEATAKAYPELKKYYDQIDNVDTSKAVEEISKLGNSLDLSQYQDNPEAAINAINSHIDEVKTTYQTKMGELKTEAEALKKQIDLTPGISDEAKEAAKLSIDHAYDEAGQQLTSKTNEILGTYGNTLKGQMESVVTQASQDWDKGLVSTFLQPYNNKQEYILYQLQQYTKKMVDGGVKDSLISAYSALPGDTQTDVVNAMFNLAANQENAYKDNLAKASYGMAEYNTNVMQTVLNAVNNLDFSGPAEVQATGQFNALKIAMQGLDFKSLGELWNKLTGNAMISDKKIVEDANRLVAKEGSNAFSDEYKTFLTDNKTVINEMGKIAVPYGKSFTEGFNKGISDNAKDTQKPIEEWMKKADAYIHGNPFAPFGSPNKKTMEYGKDFVTGFNLGITNNMTSSQTSIQTWFQAINTEAKSGVATLKNTFKTLLSEALTISIDTDEGSFKTAFENITKAVTDGVTTLGKNLQETILPNMKETYIAPFFTLEQWQPLFDTFKEEVLAVEQESFNTWFTESMTTWWEESLITWFAVEKWDKEIIKPLEDLIHERFTLFEKWWTLSMATWWETKVVPWFIYKKWNDKFMIIHKAAEDVFIKVLNTIKLKMSEAEKAVREACKNIKSALSEIISAISEVESKLSSLGSTSGNIKVNIPKFATGGYPTRGSLFIANEAGPELVGRMNGRTAVSSNDEITGIRDAIVDTSNIEAELLSRLVMIDQAILDKDVVIIGDRELARIVGEGSSQMGMNIIS